MNKSLLHNSLEGGLAYSHSKIALVTEMEEHMKLDKLAKYLEKQKKHEEMMSNQKEYHDYQLGAVRQKQRQRQEQLVQAKREFQSEMKHKHQSILENERQKDENVDFTKLENEVSQIRKRELLKLKMQDMKEQYGEVQDF